MKSTTTWESIDVGPASAASNGHKETASARGKIGTLKELTLRLFQEMQSIREVNWLSVEDGVDFYEEVRRFEIDLITSALLQTAGHQGRAAKLLRLKVTTLNSKIKHYNIHLAAFVNGHMPVEANEIETRQHV
jgi:transcriptional regulator with GAF, ATPase, and Fis domain